MNLLLLIEISHQQKLNLELAMEMITNSKELEKESFHYLCENELYKNYI